MSDRAKELLMNVYKAYSDGEDYTINTPPSSQVHAFNMAVNEIKDYIRFLRRDMVKVSITLTDCGLEYCMESFGEV